MASTQNNVPAPTQRCTTKSVAAAPAAGAGARHNKENESARPTRTKLPSAKARAAAEAAYDDDDDDENYKADSEQDSSGEDFQVDQQRARGRGGREVCLSEKAAQQGKSSSINSFEEQEEAAARKALKAAKAAQKKHQQETGEEPQPTPLQDTVFQSRKVDVHTKKNKTLVPRDSRIPVTPVHCPATSSKESQYNTATVSSQGGSDGREYARPSSPTLVLGVTPPPWVNARSGPRACQTLFASTSAPAPLFITSVVGPCRLGIRIRSPPPLSDLAPQPQAQKVNDHQGRARAKDYDSTTQEIVATAIMYFRCLLATEDTFPDHTSESHLLTLAWAMAHDEHKIAMDLAPDIAKLITSRTSQMRGELKTKVRGLVELTFGFESGQNKKNVRKNRQLAEDLKEDMGYAHQVNPSKAEGRKGLYKANIIQKATNLMWFSNRRAEGALHPEIFGPALPKPTLALVLTAVECGIECGIDEWATGIKTDVPFTSADYRSIYTDHINSMTAFEKRSAPRDILGNILTRLHNVGRFHSGSQPLVAARTTSLSTSAIDAAIREYDEDSETVTEGEFGDDDDADAPHLVSTATALGGCATATVFSLGAVPATKTLMTSLCDTFLPPPARPPTSTFLPSQSMPMQYLCDGKPQRMLTVMHSKLELMLSPS
ncbi:hypothetical protein K438DRAFT_1975214 [Mycena galopus ATCC 62051]|nr:hypothetical protein K438DRAFT_1975214 [Mycena galopus ATCC 62051]